MDLAKLILGCPQRYSRKPIGGDIEFVKDQKEYYSWLYNRKTNVLRPLVQNKKAVFCSMGDIDAKALAYIRKECPGWYLDAEFRFWVYEGRGGKSFPIEWTVQPDGRYWADEDGFGADNDREITLHGWIDANGKVIGKLTL